MPRHVAIIMDGNNRWARQRRLPGVAGHRAGVESVRAVVETCGRQEIPYLTLFAFSSENWQRPPREVSALMDLFLNALEKETARLHENNVRLRIVGDRSRFSAVLRRRMEEAEALTADNDALTLSVAANYGGRWDIAQACAAVAREALSGRLHYAEIDQEVVGRYMSLSDVPPPDLCIRTGGEHRISNFLLWQFAYTELYFTDTYWPDFRKEAMLAALQDYARRQRRFGLTSEQVEGKSTC